MDITPSTSSADPVSSLYEIAYKLDENQQFPGDEELFKKIIDLSQVNKQTKQLSSQFFSKYFKRFPSTQEKVIDSLIDLIEEDDIPVRVSALKAIPSICTDNPEYIEKLVHILSQLLNTDSPLESESAKNSIIELYKLNSANTLDSILLSLASADTQKDFMLKFIKERLMFLIRSEYRKSTMEAQSFFRDRILKLIATSKDSEIGILVELFNCFPKYALTDAVVFCDTLLSFVENQHIADSKKKLYFVLDMLIKKTNNQQQNNEPINSKIFEFYKKRVFPSFKELEEADQIEFITKFSQLSQSININDAPDLFEIVFNLLKEKIPVPAPADYDFKLTTLEALLISFSHLGSKSPAQMRRLCAYKTNTGQPSDMATDLDPSKFDDFVARLRVLNDRIGQTDAKLKKAIEVLPKSETQQLAQLVQSQKTTSNLILLIRNLSKNPPHLTLTFRPSFVKDPNPMKQFKKQISAGGVGLGSHHTQHKHQNNNNNKQQQGQQQGQQQQSKNRYQPYVPPSLRRSNDKNKTGGQGQGQQQQGQGQQGVQLAFFTDKSTKSKSTPSSFKGRGNKSF